LMPRSTCSSSRLRSKTSEITDWRKNNLNRIPASRHFIPRHFLGSGEAEVGRRIRGLLERLLGSRRNEIASESATDSELLRRFAVVGDQEAFELLVWRHGVMVLGLCQRQIHDEHIAEDAFQAVFLVLAKKARAIRSGNVAGWLYHVARRVAARAERCRGQMRELPIVAAEQTANPIERDELFQLLDDEVARLPERLRRPVLLCYLGGRSTEEAARELGCPRGTILSRLSTARKRLAERLTRRGVALPAVLPVVGLGLNGRLVSGTVTAALRFVTGRSPLDPVSLLANGVIQTMLHNKLLALFGVVILIGGLIGGVGWVTAQSEPSGRVGNLPLAQAEPKQELQLAIKDDAQQPKPKESKHENDANEQAILKLKELAGKLRSELAVHEDQIRRVKSKALAIDPKDESDLQITQSRYNLERELLLEEIHEQAGRVRAAREKVNNPFVIDKEYSSAELAKHILDLRMKGLENSKEALKHLDERYIPELTKFRGRLNPQAPDTEQLELRCSLLREQLSRIENQLLAATFRQLGVQDSPTAESVEQKLDRLSREVSDLRKEFGELKKMK